MTDVATSASNSLLARCERWVAATVNATADARASHHEIASACPCDSDPNAVGQPPECGAVVVPTDARTDHAPSWWSSLFVTMLGIGFFGLTVTMFVRYVWHQNSMRRELILRRFTELLESSSAASKYVGVVLPCGEAAAAKRLPDEEQTPGPDGGPPAVRGDDGPSVSVLLGIDAVDGVEENRRKRMFQFAPAYATLRMESLLLRRMREDQTGATGMVDRLREAQVREQERIWHRIAGSLRNRTTAGAGDGDEHVAVDVAGPSGGR